MAYNEHLADRINAILKEKNADFFEKKMFGGLCFMLGGNMCCGIVNDDLVVRVKPDRHQPALDRPGARPMDFTGRSLKGMVYIGPDGCKSETELKSWVDEALEFVLSLPPKQPRTTGKAKGKS